MASKQISPAAQLLRHSKLFSVPKPIRKPSIAGSGGLNTFESDTATPSHPTHAAIGTSTSGRRKGDWGLKRNLPIRKTASRRNAIIKVNAVDNIDHYTDWEQGTPHAISLKKFQEMNMPIVRQDYSNTRQLSKILDTSQSVFDVYEPDRARELTLKPSQDSVNAGLVQGSVSTGSSKVPQRWKFRGPWLAGMAEHEFETYIERKVKPHRAEFKKYLWSWMLKSKQEKLQSEQLSSGALGEDHSVSLTEEEYEARLVELRHEGTQLYALMWDFLDLPGKAPDEQNDQSIGPPTTHPSGGLSYLRTENIMQNHPALGPVRENQPVPARVLQMSKHLGHTNNDREQVLGIAGFVSKGRMSDVNLMFKRAEEAGDEGEKIFVRPTTATIDERGRTNIKWQVASKDSVAVWENEYEQKAFEQEKKETTSIQGFSSPKKNVFAGRGGIL